MKKRIIASAILFILYAAALLICYFTIPKKEPQFPIPEYIELHFKNDLQSTETGNFSEMKLYEKNSKYYISYENSQISKKIELTHDEFLRCACINIDDFDRFESSIGASYATIKYPGKKAKDYGFYNASVFGNPCWQMMHTYAMKSPDDADRFKVNLALQDTFDKYRITRGSYICTDMTLGVGNTFFYGDCMDQIYNEEDSFDQEIFDEQMADLAVVDLYVKGKLDKYDLSESLDDKKQDIREATGKKLSSYIDELFEGSLYERYLKNRTVSAAIMYPYLNSVFSEYDKSIGEDAKEIMIDECFEYIDKYEDDGYIRVVTYGDTVVFLCYNSETHGSILVAETSDKLTRKAFISDIEKVLLNEGDGVPEGDPYVKAHFIQRLIIASSAFVVIFIGLQIVLTFINKKNVSSDTTT